MVPKQDNYEQKNENRQNTAICIISILDGGLKVLFACIFCLPRIKFNNDTVKLSKLSTSVTRKSRPVTIHLWLYQQHLHSTKSYFLFTTYKQTVVFGHKQCEHFTSLTARKLRKTQINWTNIFNPLITWVWSYNVFVSRPDKVFLCCFILKVQLISDWISKVCGWRMQKPLRTEFLCRKQRYPPSLDEGRQCLQEHTRIINMVRHKTQVVDPSKSSIQSVSGVLIS
jgi:hypothetical protein